MGSRFGKIAFNQICTHSKLLTLYDKYKWWYVEQLGPKMVITEHIVTFIVIIR